MGPRAFELYVLFFKLNATNSKLHPAIAVVHYGMFART